MNFAYDVHNVSITDNLIYGIANDVFIGNNFSQIWNNTLDQNDYSPHGVGNAQFQWKQKTWAGLSDYQAGTGNDKDSIFENPNFVNALTGDPRQTGQSKPRAYGA